jgi:hypothetical protein
MEVGVIKYLLSIKEEIHKKALEVSVQEDRSVASVYRRIITRYFQKRKDNKQNGKENIQHNGMD